MSINPTKGHFGNAHYGRGVVPSSLIGAYDSDRNLGVVNLPWEWGKVIRPGEPMFMFPVNEEPECYAACVPSQRYLDVDIQRMIPFGGYVYKTPLMQSLNHDGPFVYVPESIASRVGIRNRVVMVGVGNSIEFWNPQEIDRNLELIYDIGLDALTESLDARIR